MSFVSAGALLWMIPLAGIIVALYLLKMRRKDLKVPATFLWPSMVYEIRANALFQKLKFSWLLVLQLLALAAIVFALARPQVRTKGLGGELTVIVLDTSASMSAREGGQTRFEMGRKIAQDIVSSVKMGDRLAIIEAGPTPKIVSPLSEDPAKMQRALNDLNPTDAENDVGEALRLASSIVSQYSGARIVLISDGVFSDIRDFSPGKAQLVFQRVGKSDKNVAIAAFGAGSTSEGTQLFFSLKNYGSLPSLGTLRLFADGEIFNALKVEVPAKGTYGKSVPIPTGAKVLRAELEAEDDLKSDNFAVALSDPDAQLRVLLVSQGDIFLERALSLDPRVILDRAQSLPETETRTQTSYDIIIFDGVPAQEVAARGVICFGSAGAGSPVRRTGTASKPAYQGSEGNHPVMRSVDLRDTYIDKGEKVEPTARGTVVATSDAGPLIVVASQPKRSIYVSFKPMDSDFPLQVAFPIFIANAIDYLIPRGSSGETFVVEAGKPFSIPAVEADQKLTVTTEKGDKTEIAPAGGSYVVRSMEQIGRYTLEVGGKKTTAYAILRSDLKSNIKPQDRVLIGQNAVAAESTTLRLSDFYKPLLLLALLVLAGEWWLFMRRS
ncbi:MAG: BatA and WFA domain-containing protein [Fimbriimonadaceae bacterium]|nr:BatA and WFA domain-containing protein [Fimbriimonadaceae bacterium]